nr:MAG TPA: hypothetical protein [Inoviridae sp.]
MTGGKIKVNVYLTKKQYNQLCRYMEFCECYATPAEMASRLVQVGLSEAVKRGAIQDD